MQVSFSDGFATISDRECDHISAFITCDQPRNVSVPIVIGIPVGAPLIFATLRDQKFS
jgi:hypothetical protein